MNITSGIIVVDKEKGITSFKIVSILRRMLKIKKVGHMGTLDPMATGVLPIMLGSSTKALSLLENHNKGYRADMKFGIASDTQDISGNIVARSDKKVTQKELQEILPEFIGDIQQVPPMYSALKKDGVRLYDLAREGIIVEREARTITIHSIDLANFDTVQQTATIDVRCSSGTYIRTLCNDIAERLGALAVMTALRRTMSNGFTLKDALKIEEIENAYVSESLDTKIFSTDYLFRQYPSLNVSELQAARFKNGARLNLNELRLSEKIKNKCTYRLYQGDKFVGLGVANLREHELSFLKCFI